MTRPPPFFPTGHATGGAAAASARATWLAAAAATARGACRGAEGCAWVAGRGSCVWDLENTWKICGSSRFWSSRGGRWLGEFKRFVKEILASV